MADLVPPPGAACTHQDAEGQFLCCTEACDARAVLSFETECDACREFAAEHLDMAAAEAMEQAAAHDQIQSLLAWIDQAPKDEQQQRELDAAVQMNELQVHIRESGVRQELEEATARGMTGSHRHLHFTCPEHKLEA